MKGFLYILLFAGFIMSCDTHKDGNQGQQHEGGLGQMDSVYYTCPMHPSVISNKPGACPICGMTLVKKKFSQDTMDEHSQMLHLDDHQQLMANIKTDTAQVKTISTYNTITGTVAPDENLIRTVSARIKGRVEKLFVKNPGTKIQKGQEIMQLYSEQLLADENDYLNVLKQKEQFENQKEVVASMVKSARQKLALWGLTEEQIESIEKNKSIVPYLSFFSDVTGYLSKIEVREGQYVSEGDVLFEVADINKVWIEAQLYTGENTLLNSTSEIQITFDVFPEETFTGKIAYYNPIIESNSKINLVRISMQNTLEKIRPGMMAHIHLRQGGKKALVIPKSAIMVEKMKMVWLQTKPGMFERRMVQTGVENKDEIEIISGIDEGELVVSSGAYLLNSEFVLRMGGTAKHQH